MYYTMTNGKIMIAVTANGGELISIINHKADNKEYIWAGDAKYWDGHSPNLFPIVGRVKEGKYTYKGKEYSIMSPHGFVWVTRLNMIKSTDNSITFNLKSNTETLKCYPFEFDYNVTHTINESKVIVTYEITNTSLTENMLFAMGAHPGFNVPLNSDEKFEDYYLEFSEKSTPNELECKEAYLTGKTKPYKLIDDKILPLTHNLFDNDAILLQDHIKKLTLKSKVGKNGLTMTFPDFKYLGIWHTNKTDAPFVCIEPWNGVPSLFESEEILETKKNMMTLKPQEVYKVSYEIEVF